MANKKQLTNILSYAVLAGGNLTNIPKQNSRMYITLPEENLVLNFIKQSIREITGYAESSRYGIVTITSEKHPFFTVLQRRLYLVGNHKHFDEHTLKMLDQDSMKILYWCMKVPGDTPTISLYEYSYGDAFLLKKAIKDNLNLEFNVKRNGRYYYLELRKKDEEKFAKVIRTEDPVYLS